MQRLGIVLFGANVFDYHKELNNLRFANSAKELRKILSDQSINRGRETEVLDLYNKALLPNEAATKIIDFLGKDTMTSSYITAATVMSGAARVTTEFSCGQAIEIAATTPCSISPA